MGLEEELLEKSKKLLAELADREVITVREYRRKMACIRLNDKMLKSLMEKHIKNGSVKRYRKGYILIKSEAQPPRLI